MSIDRSVFKARSHRKGSQSINQEDGIGFFRLFYKSSEPVSVYSGDIGASLRLLGQPFQGAASAVVGGIISAFDNALTILNEDFDGPNENSGSTKPPVEDDENEMTAEDSPDNDSFRAKTKNLMSKSSNGLIDCCRKVACTSAVKTSGNSSDAQCSDDSPRSSIRHSDDLLASNFYGDDSASLQNSSIANTLLNGYDSDDYMDNSLKLAVTDVGGDYLSTSCSQSISGGDGTIRLSMKKDAFVSIGNEGGNELKHKDVDADYFIVQNEQETNEGWLVVSED